jgi:hypothetical protein
LWVVKEGQDEKGVAVYGLGFAWEGEGGLEGKQAQQYVGKGGSKEGFGDRFGDFKG